MRSTNILLVVLLTVVWYHPIRANTETATCTNTMALDAVAAQVESVQEAINAAVSKSKISTTVEISKIGTSIAELGEQLATINRLLNASAVATAAAAAAAGAGSGGTPPAITLVGFTHDSCGSSEATACSVAYHSDDTKDVDPMVKVLVRTPGAGFYNMPGVYLCEYTIETTNTTVIAAGTERVFV
jgi:hypothetical protein